MEQLQAQLQQLAAQNQLLTQQFAELHAAQQTARTGAGTVAEALAQLPTVLATALEGQRTQRP